MAESNGKPPKYIQQVVPSADPCPNCGWAAMVARVEMLIVQEASPLALAGAQQSLATPVSANVLCFHCLHRDIIAWDALGFPHVTAVGDMVSIHGSANTTGKASGDVGGS